MDDIDALQQLINQSIINGLSQAQTFGHIHSQFGLSNNSTNYQAVREVFQHLKNNEMHKIPQEFHNALVMIRRAYTKLQRSIEARECPFLHFLG